MINGFISGLKGYAGAFQLISKLKLWKYFVIPVFISIITASIIGTLSYTASDNIGNYLSSFWQWEWGKETVTTISAVFGGLLIVFLGLLLFKHIVLALSAPFMGPVSEKIEAHLLGKDSIKVSSSFLELLVRGVRIGLRNITKEILFTIPILLIGLIPIVGVFSTLILFLMQAYYAGFGNMDYTLERYFNYSKSKQFVKKNRGVAMGNGAVFLLLLLIPFIGVILVLPFSVTAASVKTIELIHQDKINER